MLAWTLGIILAILRATQQPLRKRTQQDQLAKARKVKVLEARTGGESAGTTGEQPVEGETGGESAGTTGEQPVEGETGGESAGTTGEQPVEGETGGEPAGTTGEQPAEGGMGEESNNETDININVNMPDIAPPKINLGNSKMPHLNLEGLKNIAPTIKIIFGWGQILSSFNLTFKIKWPVSFDVIMTAMYAPFNVDLFSFFKDFGCFVDSSYTSAFAMHMAMLPMLISVIAAAYLTARLYKKLMCCKLCRAHYDNKTLWARVLKLINLVVFFMYPGIGLRIFRVFLPFHATTQY